LKTIAISQFHALERKIQTYEELVETVERFFYFFELESIPHPFVRPQPDIPMGIVAVTSDRGLLGGLNHRVMTATFGRMQNPQNQLVIIGQQGQNYMHGMKVSFKGFASGEDDQRYHLALHIRDHIIHEVLGQRIGAVKIIYPFATSMQMQKIMEVDLLPCTSWPRKDKGEWGGDLIEGMFLESEPQHLVEYLVYLSMGQKIFEILQFARLAEFAARTIHLEESSEKIKNIDKKLQWKYFRARHEIIDQQMRELFSARSLYAEENA
jgi:F-type H+-transporting ATPase subunit gamma